MWACVGDGWAELKGLVRTDQGRRWWAEARGDLGRDRNLLFQQRAGLMTGQRHLDLVDVETEAVFSSSWGYAEMDIDAGSLEVLQFSIHNQQKTGKLGVRR